MTNKERTPYLSIMQLYQLPPDLSISGIFYLTQQKKYSQCTILNVPEEKEEQEEKKGC